MTGEMDQADIPTQVVSDRGSDGHASASYSSDSPVTMAAGDRFRRWPFAQRVAQVIAKRRDQSSIVVGIYGEWGEGKTTVLNFIEEELRHSDHVLILHFNPWRFGDEDTLLRGFFFQLSILLQHSLTTRAEEIGTLIRRYIRPVAGLFGKEAVADGAADLLGEPDLEVLRKRIGDVLREAGRRVVILVDDIDRLDKDEIHSVFRLVKLTADFENTAYVLAFDDEMVAGVLQERYGVNRPGAGRAFLEKIIQIPLRLPAADYIALRQFCFEGVDQALTEAEVELSDQQAQEFGRNFVDAFETRLRTPRMAKLYANILSFSLPILKAEIHPVDLMLIEGMRVFYPKLYALVRVNSEVVLGPEIDLDRNGEKTNEIARQRLAAGLDDLDPDTKKAATKLLCTLFPQLNAAYGNMRYGSEWKETWAKSQRIAAREYFPRYFSYSISERDVADEAIRSLFAAAEHQTPEQISQVLASLVNASNADKFVWKIRRQEHAASPAASQTLALAFARSSALLPDIEALSGFLMPRSQIAIAISNLLENIPTGEDRLAVAEKVLREADSLTFACECFQWFPPIGDEDQNPEAFSEEEKRHLGTVLARRIASEAGSAPPIFVRYPKEATRLLYIWGTYGEAKQAEEYVRAVLASEPARVLDLLASLLGTVWSDSGSSRKRDFERNQYNVLVDLVPPRVIEEALKRQFGTDYVIPEQYPRAFDDEESPQLRMALQFGWLHEHVSAQGSRH
jgi:hypothetical protein